VWAHRLLDFVKDKEVDDEERDEEEEECRISIADDIVEGGDGGKRERGDCREYIR
jgi:hypothetical protein